MGTDSVTFAENAIFSDRTFTPICEGIASTEVAEKAISGEKVSEKEIRSVPDWETVVVSKISVTPMGVICAS